jgi:mannose-6-phosphate isomerase-like protein (cupin superfamily)
MLMIIRKDSLTPIDFAGLTIHDFTSTKATGSCFTVVQVPAHTQHPLAKSNKSDKYYYVMHGTICFRLNQVEHKLGEGDFCLVNQGESFSYRNDTNETVALILVHTPPFELQEEVSLESTEERIA